jgi:hypothetical protein
MSQGTVGAKQSFARTPWGTRRAKLRFAPTLYRSLVITITSGLLLATLYSNSATALNHYQDIYVTLSARPLSMGGAAAALPQPASVFSNPACLAALRRFTIMQNHSARHFGYTDAGGHAERDQLDGDTEAIVVPLPLSTYAHGWTASGEYGYDYRNHPADGSLGYPRDHYWGTESYDALAGNLGLPVALGVSQRRSMHIFEPDVDGAEFPWQRLGEGNTWGIYARVFPSLTFGHSEMKHDYDWALQRLGDLPDWQQDLLYDPGWKQTNTGRLKSSRIKTRRSGFAFQPTGWLTLASDDVRESYVFRDPPAGFGTIHTGDKTIRRNHLGGELRLGNLAAYRWGLYDGCPTVGGALDICGVTINYAECADLLPEIIGSGEQWKDVHIYGFQLNPY